MKVYLIGLMAIGLQLAASSCSPIRDITRRQSDTEKVAGFIALHPELVKAETVQVRVPFYVPQLVIKKEFTVRYDTVYLQREVSQLDSLLSNLSTSLDSAQKVATKAKVRQLLSRRPVLRDTLCFDTLGVFGRIWQHGRQLHLHITQAARKDSATGKTVVQKLSPCPPLQPCRPPAFALLQPATYGLPWYVWLLLGIILGACLLQGAVMLMYRFLTRRP